MPTPTPTDLAAMAAEILGLDAKATPGPWLPSAYASSRTAIYRAGAAAFDNAPVARVDSDANRDAICIARTSAPAIARAYLAAQARIEALEGALRGLRRDHEGWCKTMTTVDQSCDCEAAEHNMRIDAALEARGE